MGPHRASAWLTAVRLERLCGVLREVPSSQMGAPLEDVVVNVWSVVGGERADVPLLIDLLRFCGLVSELSGVLCRTRDGDRVVRSLRQQDRTALGYSIIRAGLMHDQARRVIEAGAVGRDGSFTCEHRIARACAPQLIGLLSWWEIQVFPVVVIPKPVIRELDTVWALLPPVPVAPAWVVERQEIGNRAEMYTVQHEKLIAQEQGRAPSVVWVAQESSEFGWDVEDRASHPIRRIEVKGSRETEPVFYFSENEWKKAHDHKDSYEVQFWGGIDLSRRAADEFPVLLASGFPLIVRNIAAELGAGNWQATSTRWRIQRSIR